MLNILKNESMNVVIVEDYFVSAREMRSALNKSCINAGKVSCVYWGPTEEDDWTASQLQLELNGPDSVPFPAAVEEYLADCDVLMIHWCPITDELLEKAPNLKLIMTARGGLEHIDVKAASRRNIPVVNVIRNAIPVAEFTIGMMLSLTRNISNSHCDMIRGIWNKNFPNAGYIATLQELKIGMVGMGNIGIEVVKRLIPFETEIIAWDPFADKDRLERNGLGSITLADTKEDVFKEADIVSLHLRLVPETEKIIGEEMFDLMKPSAYFINSARGGLVDYNALITALKEHKIAGAAIDVFESEPPEFQSGLTDLDNILMTPHIAGMTETAIPMCPHLLMKEVDKVINENATERIVNYRDIIITD